MSAEVRFHSVWLEGAKAARAGQASINCKYGPDSYLFVAWHNGWAWVKYEMAREPVVVAQSPPAPQYNLDDV